MQNQMY